MARTYRRDANGRFAGGGGSSKGGGSKRKFSNKTRAKGADRMTFKGRDSEGMAVMGQQRRARGAKIPKPPAKAAPMSRGKKGAATKASDKARAADLKAKGTTGLGSRVKAKGFAGKKAKETAGGLRSGGGAKGAGPRGTISGNAKVRAAGAMKRQRSAARAASKAGAKPKTGQQAKFAKKALGSAAKSEFKKLRSESRAASRYSGIMGNTPAKAGAAKRKLNTFIAKRGATKAKKGRKK